jgi:glycolate oxidase iron-sulfur subunit
MERLVPPVSAAAINHREPDEVRAVGDRRKRVALLLGCVQRVFFPHVNDATVRVLSAEGCDVAMPREQGCCGALMLHAGREEEAAQAARRLIDVFERAGVDRIVVNAAGCGSAMKEYAELLRDDSQFAERARAFSDKCVDVSEILAELEPRATRHPIDMRVVYHDTCHLRHAQRVTRAPRTVLASIPGVTVHDVAEADICCGSAGIYNMVEPEAASQLRDRKVAHLRAPNPDVIVSGNPGCLMQIASGLEISGHRIRTMHLVELLDASIRGSSTIGNGDRRP